MTPLFEAVYTDTEEMVRQVCCKVMKKKRIFYSALMLAFAFIFVLLWCSWETVAYLLAVFVYVLLAVWYYFMPQRYAKKAYKNRLQYYNGTIPTTNVEIGESIVFRDIDSVLELPYDKLKEVHLLKGYIAFELVSKTWYAVPLNAFTKGTPKELLAFLQEQYPHIKLPDWQ